MKKAFAIFALVFLFVAAGFWIKHILMVNEMISKVHIMPIEESLKITDSIAKNWNKDAYLVFISLDFSLSNEQDFIAYYESPEEERLGYSVWLFHDGTIETSAMRKYNIGFDNNINKRINWMGSSKILERVLKSGRLASLVKNSNYEVSGFMEIYGNGKSEENRYWRVVISNGENLNDEVQISIDSVTGKIRELQSDKKQ